MIPWQFSKQMHQNRRQFVCRWTFWFNKNIFKFASPPCLFSFIFVLFMQCLHNKNCTFQRDLNLNRRSRRWVCWPLDHSHGPSYTSLNTSFLHIIVYRLLLPKSKFPNIFISFKFLIRGSSPWFFKSIFVIFGFTKIQRKIFLDKKRQRTFSLKNLCDRCWTRSSWWFVCQKFNSP